jgi:uncharacterized protein YbaP (TraB family)
MLGFGEAKDDSWATPCIRRALESSSELWLEVGREPGSGPDAAARRERLTHDPAGRSFFDVLEPETRVRALDYCIQLGIAPETLASQRPWRRGRSISCWRKAARGSLRSVRCIFSGPMES